MKPNKITGFLIVFFIFSIITPFVSGQDVSYVFKQGEDADIKISCLSNESINCGAGTDCFLTAISPNSSTVINNQTMTNNIHNYNLTLNENQTSQIGVYPSFVYCAGDSNTFTTFNFEVTRSGKTLGTPESIMYIILTSAIFILFLLAFYLNIKIPYKNPSNMNGETVMITKTKYLKMGMIIITYSLFMYFLNLLIAISDSFVNLGQFFGLISGIFNLMLALVWPIFISISVWGLVEILRDINKQKILDMFGRV